MIKKYIFAFSFFVLSVLTAHAGTTKNIVLKDGSVIKGDLVSFQNGVYTVQTSNLGRLQLSEANVVSVSNDSVQPQSPQSPQMRVGSTGYSSQVSAMQNQIMANPNTMQAVQAMAEDPEIIALVSDPAFIQQLTTAINSNNVESVASDPKLQKLMQNPKIRSLIQQLQQGQTAQ